MSSVLWIHLLFGHIFCYRLSGVSLSIIPFLLLAYASAFHGLLSFITPIVIHSSSLLLFSPYRRYSTSLQLVTSSYSLHSHHSIFRFAPSVHSVHSKSVSEGDKGMIANERKQWTNEAKEGKIQLVKLQIEDAKAESSWEKERDRWQHDEGSERRDQREGMRWQKKVEDERKSLKELICWVVKVTARQDTWCNLNTAQL